MIAFLHKSVSAEYDRKRYRLTDEAKWAVEERQRYEHHRWHPYIFTVTEYRIRRRYKYQQCVHRIHYIHICGKHRDQLCDDRKARFIPVVEYRKSGCILDIPENIDIRIIIVSQSVSEYAYKIHCPECHDNITELLHHIRLMLDERISKHKHKCHKYKIYCHSFSFRNKKIKHRTTAKLPPSRKCSAYSSDNYVFSLCHNRRNIKGKINSAWHSCGFQRFLHSIIRHFRRIVLLA